MGQAVNSVIGTASVGGNSVSAKGLDSGWNWSHGRCKLAAGFHLQPSSEAGTSSCAHLQEGHTVHWDQNWKPTQNNQTSKTSPTALFDPLYWKCNLMGNERPWDRTGPRWVQADHTARLSSHKLTAKLCQYILSWYSQVRSSLFHLCPDHPPGVPFWEINTMAVLLPAHRTPTGFKLFTSLFLWKALLFFKSVSYHIHFFFSLLLKLFSSKAMTQSPSSISFSSLCSYQAF